MGRMKWMCALIFGALAFGQEPRLVEIAAGFARPVDIQQPDDGTNRLFIVEQAGTVRVMRDGAVVNIPVLDIRDRVTVLGGGGDERGLLGLAFPPGFQNKQYFYLNYTNRSGATTISRFRMSGAGADTAEASSEQVLLTIAQPFSNHNGGQLQFGPDGYLYVGMGDGGSANDPQGNAQNPQSLLGKMLRLDVESDLSAYRIPATNPFVNDLPHRREIWATGVRNPWRFSFDKATGDMWIADVGQNRAEEVNVQPAASQGGESYGWNVMEGLQCLRAGCTPTGVRPIHEYTRENGDVSITGGYVYRGSMSPSLRGLYIYGDYASGRIWTLGQENGLWVNRLLMRPASFLISTFGQDRAGEVYVANLRTGSISRIEVTGPPRLTSSSVVNGASYVAGLTPGSAATAFVSGAKPAAGIRQATSLPLPTTLEEISVLVNDTPAPLYAVANVNGLEQVNFQAPFELAGLTSARVAVRRGTASSAPVDVPVFTTQPGVFTSDGVRGVLVRADTNTLVTAANPLLPGENVYLYATGLGPVDNQPATGSGTPAAPLAQTRTFPVITIGGRSCLVRFAGLAPELAGVYQVNLVVPPGIASGEQDLVLTVSGSAAPPVKVFAR